MLEPAATAWATAAATEAASSTEAATKATTATSARTVTTSEPSARSFATSVVVAAKEVEAVADMQHGIGGDGVDLTSYAMLHVRYRLNMFGGKVDTEGRYDKKWGNNDRRGDQRGNQRGRR